MAGPDGGVFGVRFVYVGEYFGELSSVVGDFKYVVLCLADEVWDVAWRGGYVAGLVEPDRGPSTPLRFAQDRLLSPLICRCLWGPRVSLSFCSSLAAGRLEAAAVLGAGMSEL